MSKYDKRSKHAIRIDKALQATTTLPRTKAGIAKWKKNPAKYDLAGYDTSHQTRMSNKWGRVKHAKSMAEKADKDTYDYEMLMDKKLSGRENKQLIRSREKDYMRY